MMEWLRQLAGRLVVMMAMAAILVGTICTAGAAAEPSNTVIRDAFMLGFSYANGHNLYARNPDDPKARAVYDEWMADAVDYGKALGVPVDTTRPTPSSSSSSFQVGVIAAGRHHAGLVAIQLAARHGHAAEAALQLGYRASIAIEYVPYLRPDDQSNVVGELRTLASRIALPRSIVDRYADVLSRSTNREKNIAAMFAFKGDVVRHYEGLGAGTSAGAQRQLNIWLMGWKLGLATLGQTRGAAPDVVERMFEESRARSAALNVRLPALPEATSDSASDTARAIHYLLNQAGESVGKQLTRLYGPGASALFELAIKSSLALLLYAPDDDMGQTLAEVIDRSGRQAGLPATIYAPLVKKMRARAPYPEVKAMIGELDDRITAHFAMAAR
jgi:hypothetical protein